VHRWSRNGRDRTGDFVAIAEAASLPESGIPHGQRVSAFNPRGGNHMTTSEFVEVQIDGKTYSGTYEVVSGVVTVSTPYGRKSTQVGSSPPRVVARSLLRDLVREETARPDPMIEGPCRG
jgi:hypothetical protein